MPSGQAPFAGLENPSRDPQNEDVFTFGGRRRASVGAALLAITLAVGGCAGTGTGTPSAPTAVGTSVARPADGNCTYVTAQAASSYLGRTVTPMAVDASPSDVDRCHYGAASVDLAYAVAYYDDAEGATRALASLGVTGDSVDIGDQSMLDDSESAADLAFRWGPFVVTVFVTGSTTAPAKVARAIASDIRTHLG
jgi:hypothetical protein